MQESIFLITLTSTYLLIKNLVTLYDYKLLDIDLVCPK
jgi:hypothetical protein